MEHWNRSSYVKVMVLLQTDSELEDKTVRKWKIFTVVPRNWWKRWGKIHELDSNKTEPATRPQPGHKLNTADSETEICKGYGAENLWRWLEIDWNGGEKHTN